MTRGDFVEQLAKDLINNPWLLVENIGPQAPMAVDEEPEQSHDY